MAETLRIENEGVGLHVEVDGPEGAVAVVFLHGMTSCTRTWAWLPADLTRGRRIVQIDFRGHGRSDHAPGTYDLAHYGPDVVGVLRELTTDPAVLVGHSLGGAVAWWVAQNRPELVAAALLEDPPLYLVDPAAPEFAPFGTIFEFMRANALAFREAGLTDDEIAERVGAMPMGPPGAPTFREIAFDDAVAAMGFAHRRLDVGVIDAAIDGSLLAAMDTTSPAIPPITVLAADDALAPAFPSEHAERLAETHPAVEVIRVTGSGHGIHDERRYRSVFCAHLQRFLDAHAPAA